MKKLLFILWVLFFSQPLLAADQPASTSTSFVALPQILGGDEAVSGAWPWMTAILNAGESADLYFAQYCGGVLIAPNWVLTAAHCVDGKSASDIDVAVGVYDLASWSGTRIGVQRIVKHPAYVNFYANDIALLELKSASVQQPITLFSGASAQGIDPKLLGQMTTLVGWGLADTTTEWYFPSKLRQVNLPVVADSYCNNVYDGVTLSSSQLCGGYADAKDACTGDSGGPMMLVVDGQWVHVGLVSFGADCQTENGYYGVYTRSSAHVDFIKQYVAAAKFTAATKATQPLPWLMLLLKQ